MNTLLLRSQNISKEFQIQDKQIEVLKDINFYVRAGKTVLIYGRSGQGKSVLLSLLCGLDSPSAGDIYFDGIWYSSCTLKQLAVLRRTHIGIIFQNLNLLPSWTALENVEAALEEIIESPFIRRSRSLTILEKFGLGERVNHMPSELSMGEQQRVAIARTLIKEPKLILADEPTGDLDEDNASFIAHLLYSYTQENNASLIVATHGHYPRQDVDHTFTLDNGILHPDKDKEKKLDQHYTNKLITYN